MLYYTLLIQMYSSAILKHLNDHMHIQGDHLISQLGDTSHFTKFWKYHLDTSTTILYNIR